ncbi:hypothetical protein GCM10020367_05150 [Streptomyces sannanensis]|uniref:Uncharacterized protein n=1 Tax=Streptomyces sannanensis TaxID=285536 RepID=A0ABP6S4P6_9ACTN
MPTQVGTGRLDVARAHDQGVYADPGNLDLGKLAYPHDGGPVTKQVTYTNDTDAAVTLALTAPAEFHLGASTMTVPAKGSATVDVTVDPKALSDGLHSGYLTATDGTVTTRTTLGVYAESPHYDLNLHVTGRDGAPPSYGFVILIDGQSGAGFLAILTSQDHKLRVPPGRYDAFAAVYGTRDTPTGVEQVDSVLMADHDVVVGADTDLRFDARAAKEVRLHTPQPVDRAWLMVSYQRFFKAGDHEGSLGAVDFFAGGNERVWLAEAAPPTTGRLQLNTRWYTYEPLIRARVSGLPLSLSPRPVSDSRVLSPTAAHASPRFDGMRTARVVDVDTADPTALAGRNLAGAVALIRTAAGVPYEDQINAVAKAGAGYAVLWRDLSGGFRPAVGEDLPIPSFVLPHEEATALRAAAAQRTVQMKLQGRESPTYGYDIIEPLTRMPDGLDLTVRTKELASIDTTVNALAPGHTVGDMRMGFISGVGYVPAFSGVTLGWPAGVHRTDYVRAAPGFQYLERATPAFEPNPTGSSWDSAHEQYGQPLALRPGQRITERWNTPVWRPGIPAGSPGIKTGFPGATRTGDTIDLSVSGWNDGGAGHAGIYADVYGGAQAKVYRNGELFAQGGVLAGTLPVGPERATYRLTHDAQRAAASTPYSAQTHTAWTFTSSHVDGDRAAALPLLQLDYQVDTDTYGRADKRNHLLGLTLRQQDGAAVPVATADLSVSYDDGAHWTKVRLERIGAGRYQVHLRPPTEAAYVSLRANGADRAGDTVEQTILRAYGLK